MDGWDGTEEERKEASLCHASNTVDCVYLFRVIRKRVGRIPAPAAFTDQCSILFYKYNKLEFRCTGQGESFNVAGAVVVVWPRNCNEDSVEFLLVSSL